MVVTKGVLIVILGTHWYTRCPPKTNLEKKFGVSLDVCPDNHGHVAMTRARRWLDRCVREDKTCRCGKSRTLPRRLLRVGDKDSRTIVLVETATPNNPDHAKYACLSYRWGTKKEEILRTTRHNIDQHRKSIILKNLPQTIIDTVIVCRELSIPYLWVDSLCIIQPEDGQTFESDQVAGQDWQNEGSTMENAYGNSYLTIYAESAISCKAGFLGKQKHGSRLFQRRARVRAPNGNKVFVREEGKSFNGLDDDEFTIPAESEDSDNEDTEPYKNDGGGSVLRLRGWCLQESLIPNRRLRFCDTEMVWECNCCKICECGHILDPAYKYYLRNSQPGAPPKAKGRLLEIKGISSQPTVGSFDHVREWWKIVQDYSWRSLSEPHLNKLMGISGVASLLVKASKGQDQYLAGLWLSNIPRALCWETGSKRSGHRRLDGGVPTWSWASVDGPLFMPHLPKVQLNHVKLTEHHCELALADRPTGHVTGGHLWLQGIVMPVQLAVLDEELSNVWRTKHNEGQESDGRLVAVLRGQNMRNHSVKLDLDNVDNALSLKSDLDSAKCWMWGESSCSPHTDSCFNDTCGLFALPLLSYQKNKVAMMYAEVIIRFLVLKKQQSGAYERVGVGWCRENWSQSKDWNQSSKRVECSLFGRSESESLVKII